jgi:hypothetical protein
MHRTIFGPLLTACLIVISVRPALAAPSPTPRPIPSPPPITIITLDTPRLQPRRLATVTLSDASVVLTRAAAGKFQLVAARPNELITVVVPFPLLPLGTTAAVSTLDGGKLIGTSPVPIVHGAATIHFQVGTLPGLYRVLVLGLGRAATVQFWVQDAQRPATSPWVLNASHWQTQ